MTSHIDMSSLKLGDRLRTIDQSEAVVTEISEDGQWIKVRYVSSPDSNLPSQEDLCSAEDIAEILVSH